MRVLGPITGIAILATIGACVSTSLTIDEAKQVTDACRSEVGAVGSYQVRMVNGIPEAWPIVGAVGLQDGTDAEAAALNACIAQKVSPAPAARTPAASCIKRGSPLQGGTGYC
jgi:hypothetical protein